MKNLIGDPEHAESQMALESHLLKRLSELGDEFLDGEAYLERDGLTHYREVNQPIKREWHDPWRNHETTCGIQNTANADDA
jgi:hypothetical protein